MLYQDKLPFNPDGNPDMTPYLAFNTIMSFYKINDIDVLLLDKTGTITIGNRKATNFYPTDGVIIKQFTDARVLSAKADVGVAMYSGTQAAQEAGNMVDLDNDPTKLIEIVEIGKQLLIPRGTLTTFSIDNDVTKYFAIVPALLIASIPALQSLNIMSLHTPKSAIMSAVIFNAIIIPILIPLAL